MKRAVFIFIQVAFVLQQIIGCTNPILKRNYKGYVYVVDTFSNGKSIYIMPVGIFTFIDSTGKYKNGDIAIVEQVAQHHNSFIPSAKSMK